MSAEIMRSYPPLLDYFQWCTNRLTDCKSNWFIKWNQRLHLSLAVEATSPKDSNANTSPWISAQTHAAHETSRYCAENR